MLHDPNMTADNATLKSYESSAPCSPAGPVSLHVTGDAAEGAQAGVAHVALGPDGDAELNHHGVQAGGGGRLVELLQTTHADLPLLVARAAPLLDQNLTNQHTSQLPSEVKVSVFHYTPQYHSNIRVFLALYFTHHNVIPVFVCVA